MKQPWGTALGGRQRNAPTLLSKYDISTRSFPPPNSALLVLLLLEELVDERGLSSQTAGSKVCLFFAFFF